MIRQCCHIVLIFQSKREMYWKRTSFCKKIDFNFVFSQWSSNVGNSVIYLQWITVAHQFIEIDRHECIFITTLDGCWRFLLFPEHSWKHWESSTYTLCRKRKTPKGYSLWRCTTSVINIWMYDRVKLPHAAVPLPRISSSIVGRRCMRRCMRTMK